MGGGPETTFFFFFPSFVSHLFDFSGFQRRWELYSPVFSNRFYYSLLWVKKNQHIFSLEKQTRVITQAITAYQTNGNTYMTNKAKKKLKNCNIKGIHMHLFYSVTFIYTTTELIYLEKQTAIAV